MKAQELTFENAATQMTVNGWVCKTCGRFYGTEERLARWCCAKDLPCGTDGCTGRAPKGYTACDKCRQQKRTEQWSSYQEVEWDGETPLTTFDDDKYFFSADDLESYLDEDDLKVEDLKLVVCVKMRKPSFDMIDLLDDYLPDEGDLDCNEINKIVNKWIDENVPVTWTEGKTRPSINSLHAALK